jgi:hypothetical protein
VIGDQCRQQPRAEPHRDLLTAVENRNGTNLLSRYDYANDALARRTDRQDSFEFPVSKQWGRS